MGNKKRKVEVVDNQPSIVLMFVCLSAVSHLSSLSISECLPGVKPVRTYLEP